MLSIGEFSKICKVSTKTLRYYDEIGLIHPDQIHPENGYRYYSITQLEKMLLIQRLKAYHFSLDEIKEILAWEEDQAEEHLHVRLHRKKREIEEHIQAYASTLEQINRDIGRLEQGMPVMSFVDHIQVELVETRPRNVLFIRQKLSADDYAAGYGTYFAKLYERIATETLTLQGTPMTVYHSPEYDPAGNDTEFAIPVAEAVKGTRDFPGGLCARSVLKGAYPELTAVYARLRSWVEEEGYALTGAPYEVYVTDPIKTGDAGDLVTEVYFPVKKK
ncbi:MerR family transcriptional regulator [Paenibacillus sp. alder61]|uniref:MerR family transcriptional regulator n=1 Tax=Paenibacillus sp. alder61 TaxID=2862948 RepID=UPI001CD2587A|nr:MerR family transcriptional regulator [Paenibacillus sp. alder61]MCA1291876.1 MerR family transcriptional regulator [Paenibacillus sp. alder61]